MKVLISGATGFIGSRLCARLAEAGHELAVLSRDPAAARDRLPGIGAAHAWDPASEPAPAAALEDADAVVHLAGEPVTGRWTKAKRQAIRDSRVVGTRNLVAGIAACRRRPAVLVSGSAVGYYGDRGDEPLSEQASPGDDFLAGVCREWEHEAQAAESHGVCVTRVRTGIVLGPAGGALAQMLLPARLGLAGPLGSGRQWWPWIHIDDLVGILEHSLGRRDSAPLNGSAPEPVRQKEFARVMGRVLGRPAFLPAPGLALRALLGGFAGELLSSKKVLPVATRESGYRFRYPELEPALRDLLA